MKDNTTKSKTILFLVFILLLCSCTNDDAQEEPVIIEQKEQNTEEPKIQTEVVTEIDFVDEGFIVSYAANDHYRYGPSIMKYEDGSMDAWFSSPGNSGSQWDWITYRHSDNGIDWSEEKVVLKPTQGSRDQCSVCDPGVIYFGGYYYLAYTGTDYYEGKGSYNFGFVARSKNPDGPYEKWNGEGWGGDPVPIIDYDGGKDNWGVGEISFVVDKEDLFIYYSYIDIREMYIGLCKADLTEDWPLTIRYKGPALYQLNHDSVEVAYDQNKNTYLAFSIDGRLMEGAKLVIYESKNGKDFEELASSDDGIRDYAHNMGVAKSKEGWIDSSEDLLIGYAFGKDWGKWDTQFQHIHIIES